LYAIIQIIALITQIIVVLVIVQFVIGLLFAFNVVNTGNQFLVQVYRSINALLEPVLGPIRRVMPDTGAIDFSPLVLILLLQILMIILTNIPA
jgi:YggT family protein